MSSAPQHEKNMEDLKDLGFLTCAHDTEFYEDYYESWNYDSLVDIVAELIPQIKEMQDQNKRLMSRGIQDMKFEIETLKEAITKFKDTKTTGDMFAMFELLEETL